MKFLMTGLLIACLSLMPADAQGGRGDRGGRSTTRTKPATTTPRTGTGYTTRGTFNTTGPRGRNASATSTGSGKYTFKRGQGLTNNYTGTLTTKNGHTYNTSYTGNTTYTKGSGLNHTGTTTITDSSGQTLGTSSSQTHFQAGQGATTNWQVNGLRTHAQGTGHSQYVQGSGVVRNGSGVWQTNQGTTLATSQNQAVLSRSGLNSSTTVVGAGGRHGYTVNTMATPGGNGTVNRTTVTNRLRTGSQIGSGSSTATYGQNGRTVTGSTGHGWTWGSTYEVSPNQP